MTDNPLGRALSNAIWGTNPEYKDSSQLRHMNHAVWHGAAYCILDKKKDKSQAIKHWHAVGDIEVKCHEGISKRAGYDNVGDDLYDKNFSFKNVFDY